MRESGTYELKIFKFPVALLEEGGESLPYGWEPVQVYWFLNQVQVLAKKWRPSP